MTSLNNRNAFEKLLGDDIMFFNKVEIKPEHREQALEHADACNCKPCQHKALLRRLRGSIR